ncbi:hypothetical protein JY409_04115 [Stenotrophomonas maltophilia]|nr:hypothetical protein [Stenotrophomonas maltophilia]
MGAIDSRARFEEWIAKSYPDRDLEKHEDGRYAYAFASLSWEAWSAALTPPEVSDQNLLDLAATFETCIPFLPRAGQRNIGKAVAQLRHMAMGYVLAPAELLRIMVGCTYPVSSEIDPRGYAWSEAYLDEALPLIKAALLAARPDARRCRDEA